MTPPVSAKSIFSRLDAVAWVSTSLLLASFALLTIILTVTEVRVDWTGLGTCIVFSIAALILGLTMKLAAALPRVADVTLVVATLIGSTVCNTISVNAGLRLQFPLVDAHLLAADRFIGLDAKRLVELFAGFPTVTRFLDGVYVHANWLAVVAVILRAAIAADRLSALICYSGGLLLVTIVSTVTPAIGNIEFSGLQHLYDTGLPPGSGTYHLEIFNYYRAGGVLVDNAHLTGVAVFPSFHTIMGLIIATSLHGTRLAPVAVAFGAATIVSAVPIGGHYIIDIVGGILVWGLAMWIGTRSWPDGRQMAAKLVEFRPTFAATA
jgi:membrane-associated phospholipid phosphatase